MCLLKLHHVNKKIIVEKKEGEHEHKKCHHRLREVTFSTEFVLLNVRLAETDVYFFVNVGTFSKFSLKPSSLSQHTANFNKLLEQVPAPKLDANIDLTHASNVAQTNLGKFRYQLSFSNYWEIKLYVCLI